jgi:hypothetical protein
MIVTIAAAAAFIAWESEIPRWVGIAIDYGPPAFIALLLLVSGLALAIQSSRRN